VKPPSADGCAGQCPRVEIKPSPRVGLNVDGLDIQVPNSGERLTGQLHPLINQTCKQIRVNHEVAPFRIKRFSGLGRDNLLKGFASRL
jgi:hypothetical protein